MVECVIFTGISNSIGYHRGGGAYRVATELRRAGFSVQVVDQFPYWTWEETDKILRKLIGPETLFVGISTNFFEKKPTEKTVARSSSIRLTQTFTFDFPQDDDYIEKFIRTVRDLNPKTKLVIGGAKADRQYNPNIDYHLVGYADRMVVDFAMHLRDENYPIKERFSETTPNVRVLYWGDYPIENPQDKVIEWHESDHIEWGESLPIEVSRGCIFKCAFCSYPLNGKKKNDYVKDPAVLRDEMIENHIRWGTWHYSYADDTYNDTIEKLESLHRVYKSLPFQLGFTTYLRADLIEARPETASLLLDSGLTSCFFGIETINHASGKAIGKGLHPDRMKKFLHWLKDDAWKDRVATTSGFILGLPHDTFETYLELKAWFETPDFPLDNAFVGALLFAPTVEKTFRSKIEMNPGKYGYEVDQYGQWKNQHLDQQSAIYLATDLSNIAYDKNRISGFSYAPVRNIGYDHDTIMHTRAKMILDDVFAKTDVRIGQYKQALLNASY